MGNRILQILTKAGVLTVPEWYEAGKAYVNQPGAIPFGEYESVGGVIRLGKKASLIPLVGLLLSCGYWGHLLAGTLRVTMFYLYGFVEATRWQDFRKPGSQVSLTQSCAASCIKIQLGQSF